jgi:putative two-component system response regulator
VSDGGEEREAVLLVDDEDSALRTLARLLKRHGYDCTTASSAEEAWKVLKTHRFALILSDVNMPGDSGLELLERVAAVYPETATVMVTGMDDRKLAEKALMMGAYGYVIKPYQSNELLINVSNALRRRTLEIENRAHRERLEFMVKDRTKELWNALTGLEQAHKEIRFSQEETVEKLSVAAEFKDDDTAQHIHRMSRYCGMLAGKAGFDTERRELLRLAAVMHDVGKIGVPDNILMKPGKLTDEQLFVMKQHADMGHRILDRSRSELLQLAAKIALTHHEWWDGSGYPNGLSGTDIPIEGRIAAIADVFDALTSNRVYRKAFHLGEAVDIMMAERGTHFDPELLDLFLDSMDQIVMIRAEAGLYDEEPDYSLPTS